MPYDDGARTLFLYTKGSEGDPPEELRQLLYYMENTTEENAKNDNLKTLHQMVATVKQDGEVSLSYMKIFEREEMLLAQGRREGIEQERENARRERERADEAEKEIVRLKAEIQKMKNGK